MIRDLEAAEKEIRELNAMWGANGPSEPRQREYIVARCEEIGRSCGENWELWTNVVGSPEWKNRFPTLGAFLQQRALKHRFDQISQG